MKSTVEWLINQQSIQGFRLLAGKPGIMNTIKSVNIMDNPDTIRYITEGELILSTGYFFQKDSLLTDSIIEKLKEKKCAGLGIVLKRYLDQLPSRMLQEADKLGIPLFSIPYDYSFGEISTLIYQQILNSEISDTELIYEMYKQLNEVILREHTITDTINALGTLLKHPIAIANHQFVFLDYTSDYPFLDQNGKRDSDSTAVLSEQILNDFNKRNFFVSRYNSLLVFAAKDKHDLIGFLVVSDPDDTLLTIDYNFIQSVINLISIEINNYNVQLQNNKKEQDTFIPSIILGHHSESELTTLCNRYNFNYKQPMVCCVLSPKFDEQMTPLDKNLIWERINQLIQNEIIMFRHTIHKFNFREDIVLFLSFPSSCNADISRTTTNNFIENIAKIIQLKNWDITVGISDYLTGIENILSSYTQAIDALRIGNKVRPCESIYFYTDDLLYHLLESCIQDKHYKAYLENLITPLITFDEQNNTELTKTLETYFNAQCNSSLTAKNLFIHRNTMSARLEKIRELLPYDFNDPKNALLYQLSIYSRNIYE